MSVNRAILASCAAFLTTLYGNAHAHHSFATNFDVRSTIELTGVVADYQLRSPHSYIAIDVETEDGTTQRWDIESGAVPGMIRMGFDENTFKPGDVITVVAFPNRRADKFFVGGQRFFDSNGTPMGRAPRVAEAQASDREAVGVARLVGRWMTPPPAGGTETPLPLTPAGRRAWENYDPRLSPASTCEYATIPSLFFAPYLYDIQVDDEGAVFTHEVFSVTRRVPLNAAPRNAEASGSFGLVTGRIEGDELVVESSNYPPSGWGVAIAAGNNGAGGDVPSSDQKKTVERYSVTAEGKLRVDYTLEDPVYLTEPYSGSVEFTRVADDTPMLPFDCDLESAARFSR